MELSVQRIACPLNVSPGLSRRMISSIQEEGIHILPGLP